MFRIPVLGAAVVMLMLVAVVPSVQAKRRGKKEHALHGVVVKVEMDAGKESIGKITVKIGRKNKKKGGEAKDVERTIKVTKGTKFAEIARKPGAAKGAKGGGRQHRPLSTNLQKATTF